MAREEFDPFDPTFPPAEARERYEDWIYDAYGAPMEYNDTWDCPVDEVGYDWYGNQVVWNHYQEDWTMPPAEAREEYEDLAECYDSPGEEEEYAYDADEEEGYYDAQVSIYDEYGAPDEAEEYVEYAEDTPIPWDAERHYAEAALERPYPPAEAREEYEEYDREDGESEFGDIDDGYDEDWMGPRTGAPPAEKRVRFHVDDSHNGYEEEFPVGNVQDDGYDESWMGPRATTAEYTPSHHHAEEDWIPAPLAPPVEAREQYAAPEASTPWQQQVTQARGELFVAQQHAWLPSAAPVVYDAPVPMDTSAGRARLRAIAAEYSTQARLAQITAPASEQDKQRGRCPRKEGNVAFGPQPYSIEDDARIFGSLTRGEWKDWLDEDSRVGSLTVSLPYVEY